MPSNTNMSGFNTALQMSRRGYSPTGSGTPIPGSVTAGGQQWTAPGAAGAAEQAGYSGEAYEQAQRMLEPGAGALDIMGTALERTAGAVPQLGTIMSQFANQQRQMQAGNTGLPSSSRDAAGQALRERMTQSMMDAQFRGQQQAIAGGAEVGRTAAGLAAATPEYLVAPGAEGLGPSGPTQPAAPSRFPTGFTPGYFPGNEPTETPAAPAAPQVFGGGGNTPGDGKPVSSFEAARRRREGNIFF